MMYPSLIILLPYNFLRRTFSPKLSWFFRKVSLIKYQTMAYNQDKRINMLLYLHKMHLDVLNKFLHFN